MPKRGKLHRTMILMKIEIFITKCNFNFITILRKKNIKILFKLLNPV